MLMIKVFSHILTGVGVPNEFGIIGTRTAAHCCQISMGLFVLRTVLE